MIVTYFHNKKLLKKLKNNLMVNNCILVFEILQEFDHNKTDGCRGRISIQEFIDIFKEIATRPEIYFLMIR